MTDTIEIGDDAMTENMASSSDSARYCAQYLRDALEVAGAVQGLAMLPLIERAAMLAADIDRLLQAVREDDITAARRSLAMSSEAKSA